MWLSYLKLLWAKVGTEPKRVLEVCCGTGRLSRMLHAEGIKVAGIDLSPEMIREAKRLSSKEIRFEAQDAAEMKLGEQYEAAFSFFDSFNYITDPLRCALAIRRTAEHLKAGASFVFDLNTAYAFEQRMFDQEDMKSKTKVRHKWKSKYNPDTRMCTVEMRFWARDKQFTETHVQRAHSPEEIGDWMASAGFRDVKCFDSYTLDPPRGRSDRIHVIGIKA
jgi:ubiquinone/menaquinone biosynthesis C-methylase UbiE